VVWIVAGLGILATFGKWNGLKANEYGDVFAGLAAPIAFLWLVLGFLQQGQELKLQIEELRNTFRHQGELVEVSREQVAAQTAQIEHERRQHQLALQPHFVLSCNGSSGGPDGITYDIELTNGGASSTNVFVSVDPVPDNSTRIFFPLVDRQYLAHFTLRYIKTPAAGMVAVVRFTDAGGNEGRKVAVYGRSGRIHPAVLRPEADVKTPVLEGKMKGLWVLTLIASIVAGLVLVVVLAAAKGAPQEASGAAIALCIAIIPYVFTRAIEGIVSATWRESILSEVALARTDFKKGTESVWKQLDAIRASAPR
jgi:hypothetical protein